MSDKNAAADETEAADGASGGMVVKIPCEVYSRIVGYLRPISAWHVGKKQEFKDRRVYKLPTQT